MTDLATIQREAGAQTTRPPTSDRNHRDLDWEGSDDPDNPRNKSLTERVLSIGVVTLLAFSGAFAGSISAPAQDQLIESFHCIYEVSVLPLALYMLGLAFGPLVGAPLSEDLGRKAVFDFTTPLFIIFMLGASFAQSMTALVICRFFIGVFTSPNINNMSAIILDYTPDCYRDVFLGIYYSVLSVAATFAPIIGGVIVHSQSWRWTQWVAIILTVVCYILIFFTKETYKRKILQTRAQKFGNDSTSPESTPALKKVQYFFTVLIKRPLHMLFTEPIVSLVSLYNGMLYGLTYAFVTSIPWVFETYYGFDDIGQSLSFLGATVGTLSACMPSALIDYFYYQRRLQSHQNLHGLHASLSPENRLPAGMIGSIILPISLLASGWTAEKQFHWILPILFEGLVMASSLLIYTAANLFMLDSYGPLYGASASSAMMFSRHGMSFLSFYSHYKCLKRLVLDGQLLCWQ